MLFKFLPQDFDFYVLFDQQVDFAVEAARKFKEIVSTSGLMDEASYKTIQDIEHKADHASHLVIDHLNKTFITPFDREDIHALTKELDDIVDMINTIIGRMRVYKISGNNKHLIEFAQVIESSVLAVAQAVKGMRIKNNTKSVLASCAEVNRLETVGDRLRDTVLADLFENNKDAIAVIKLNEIYQDAETVLDICEDAAHVVESILVKQA
jgi:uncharacterized protein Yka (UPF0111/DUF47 family)